MEASGLMCMRQHDMIVSCNIICESGRTLEKEGKKRMGGMCCLKGEIL